MRIDCTSVGKDAQDPVPVSMAMLNLYVHLLIYDDPDAIDIQKIGEKAKTSPSNVAAMKGQLKRNPKIYQKLVNAGWSPSQIPQGVAKPQVRHCETPRKPANRLPAPQKLETPCL